MAKKTINTVIVLRNDASTAWSTSDRVLEKGEVGISYLYNDDGSIKSIIAKVGDGVQTYANLKQIEGVLESDPVFTQTFGKYTPKNGKVTATGTAGMTISEFVLGAFKEAKNPKVNYPTAGLNSVSCAVTNDGEIGAYVNSLSYTTTSSNGSYTDGGSGTYGTTGSATSNASGIAAKNFTWAVSSDDSSQTFSSTGTTGTYTYDNDKRPQLTGTSNTIATIECVATLDASAAYIPFNNLGEKMTTLKISGFDAAGKTTSSSSKSVTKNAYRNTWYYVGSDCTTAIAESWVREKATARKANTKDFNLNTHAKTKAKCLNIPANTKRVAFIVPGAATLNSVIDIDGMGLDVKDNFVKSTIRIKGANGFVSASAQSVTSDTATENKDGYLYTVFCAENSNGLSATGYTVSIS